MTKYISLGGSCAVAFALRENELRDIAYPFDWCQIDIKQLNLILKENFKDFENVHFTRESDHHPLFISNIDEIDETIDKGGSLILTNKYKLKIAHELYDKSQIPSFCSSLKRRIERFKTLVQPTFIRLEINNLTQEQTKTSYKQLEDFGYNIGIYPVTTQRLAMKSVEEGLKDIFERGHQNNIIDKMQTRKRLYELVDYEKYNSLDEKIYNFSTDGHD